MNLGKVSRFIKLTLSTIAFFKWVLFEVFIILKHPTVIIIIILLILLYQWFLFLTVLLKFVCPVSFFFLSRHLHLKPKWQILTYTHNNNLSLTDCFLVAFKLKKFTSYPPRDSISTWGGFLVTMEGLEFWISSKLIVSFT